MAVILAIDVGTTNVKAGIVAASGALLTTAEEKLTILRPENRAAEHDPEAVFQSVLRLCQTVLRDAPELPIDLVLSTYQFGLILLDGEMRPLTGLTTLLDTRARVTFDSFRSEFESTSIYSRTGCPPFTQYPLARLYYLKTTRPVLFEKARHILSAKAYLLWRLTGEFVTDPSTEAASQMMNMHSVSWETDILNDLGLNPTFFPELVDACARHIPLRAEVCQQLGLQHARIIPGLYDGGALAVGLGGLKEDTGVINIGTSGMLRVLTRTPVLDTLERMAIQTYYLMDGLYFAGGAVNNATIPLNWLKDNLTDGEYEEFMAEAETAGIGSRKLFFLPYLTGERDWQIGTVASGVIFGLRDFHTRAEVLRSALEGVAYCLNNIHRALSDAGIPIASVTVGGGGVRHPLWCTILANVLNLPLKKTDSQIACLVGNGILGFVADGTYKTFEQATSAMVIAGITFTPDSESVQTYARYYNFYARLLTGFRDLYREHAALDR